MRVYAIFKWLDKKWEYQGITIKARDSYKAEKAAKKKYKMEGLLIAMSEGMLLLNDCI